MHILKLNDPTTREGEKRRKRFNSRLLPFQNEAIMQNRHFQLAKCLINVFEFLIPAAAARPKY